jgi:oligoribonuclease (3'-5' exoribonuclease)
MFLWTDLETTGLDPLNDIPLAIGIIVTDDAFRELGRCEWVIGWDSAHPALRRMSDHVRDMHTRSGLLERVHSETAGIGFVDTYAIPSFLRTYLGPPAENIHERPPYAGNSVGFDKAFVERHFPVSARWYSYRCLDVTTLKLLAMATVPGAKEWDDSRPEPAHTPIADLEGSIAELAHWRRVLGRVVLP